METRRKPLIRYSNLPRRQNDVHQTDSFLFNNLTTLFLDKQQIGHMADTQIDNLTHLNDFVSQYKIIVAEFYATWCKPCVRIKCQENGVTLAKINVDTAKDVVAKHGITALPAFKVLVWNNGQVVTNMTQTGSHEGLINALIHKAKNTK